MVNATGFTTCGSAAKSFTSNSSGTFIRFTDSSGVRYGWPDGLRLSNPYSFWAKAGDAARSATVNAREVRMGSPVLGERGLTPPVAGGGGDVTGAGGEMQTEGTLLRSVANHGLG